MAKQAGSERAVIETITQKSTLLSRPTRLKEKSRVHGDVILLKESAGSQEQLSNGKSNHTKVATPPPMEKDTESETEVRSKTGKSEGEAEAEAESQAATDDDEEMEEGEEGEEEEEEIANGSQPAAAEAMDEADEESKVAEDNEGMSEPDKEKKRSNLKGVKKLEKRKRVKFQDGKRDPGKKAARRRKPGQTAAREVRHYQRTNNPLIPRAPIERVIREIAIEYASSEEFLKSGIRFSKDSIDTIHCAGEQWLIQLIQDCGIVLRSQGKKTWDLKSMLLVMQIDKSYRANGFEAPIRRLDEKINAQKRARELANENRRAHNIRI